ncbi:hypothetical protein E4U61_001656 [Claviceps capensis]|nr:hypothetical protein E4U61_001656 [Claviceps capensis]
MEALMVFGEVSIARLGSVVAARRRANTGRGVLSSSLGWDLILGQRADKAELASWWKIDQPASYQKAGSADRGRSIEQIFEYTYTPLETAGKLDDYAHRITTAEHRHNVAAPSRTLEATRVVRTTEYKICSAVPSWLPRRDPDYTVEGIAVSNTALVFLERTMRRYPEELANTPGSCSVDCRRTLLRPKPAIRIISFQCVNGLWLDVNGYAMLKCYIQPRLDTVLDYITALEPPTGCLIEGDLNAKARPILQQSTDERWPPRDLVPAGPRL